MNEIIFILQMGLILGFTLGALRLGPSALTTWVAVQALIANLFVIKQIRLFGLEVTASDAFAVGSLLGLNFLQEHFGKKEAEKATLICFAFMIFFTLAAQIHLLYAPSGVDTSHAAFHQILNHAPRILMASLVVFFVVQRIDILFFSWLKSKIPSLNFASRAFISLIVSQGLDTLLFSFAGLYGIAASMTDLIVLSFAVKLMVIFCFTPLIRLART